MTRQAVVGIDAGTTAVKAVVLAPDGEQLGRARVPLRVAHHGDRVEQDMDEVWSAVCDTVRSALRQAGDGVEIAAVGVTGQGDGAWLVDAGGRPCGPAAIWMDGSAAARVAEWERDGRGALVRGVTGSSLFPGALPVLLEQLEEDRPERLARAVHQLNCKDWIRFRLTGEVATDASEASRTYLDVSTGTYSDALTEALGHQRFRRLLAPVRPPESAAGTVGAEAADATGLPVGVPVAAGLVDAAAAGVGLGAVRPGDAYLIVGTTAFAATVRQESGGSAAEGLITLATGPGGPVLECLAPMAGAPNLDWVRSVTGQQSGDWAEVERQARDAGPGAGGVLYLPYGSPNGERAPFVDRTASASWVGMSVRTTPGQLLRAVYEGIAFTVRECLGEPADGRVLRIAGGSASSDLMCQVLADITGRPVARSGAPELGARGVAALAMVTGGVTGDLGTALTALAGSVDTFAPEPAVRDLHDGQARAFAAARDALRPVWPALRELRSMTGGSASAASGASAGPASRNGSGSGSGTSAGSGSGTSAGSGSSGTSDAAGTSGVFDSSQSAPGADGMESL
ncbi:FGGY family carbohydrate kinase [Streptomyces sp. NPDC051018]|uniref:FGGY family carbohydrate kinase n=1 Tax=Streptomyces sp. NPDC051018 TaxID=3365639 RepID=UPI0037B37103